MRIVDGCVALLALATAAALPANASPRTVPLAFDHSGGVIVHARINGTGPFRLLLDTGSARSIITTSISDRLAAPAVARTRMVSAGEERWATLARIDSLSVGAAHVGALDVIVMDGRQLRDAAGKIDGIVGQDFLRRFSYLIDRERKTLLWNPTAAERHDRGTRLRLLEAEGRYLVELPQENGEHLQMVPDTGADTLILFDTPRAAALTLHGDAPGMQLRSLTASRTARRAKVARLALGDEVLLHEPAVVVENADAGSDGLLPLRSFRKVLFDTGEKTVTLWR